MDNSTNDDIKPREDLGGSSDDLGGSQGSQSDTSSSDTSSSDTSSSDTSGNKTGIMVTPQDDSYTPGDKEADWSKVTNLTFNKKMSYFEASLQKQTPQELNNLKDEKLDKYVVARCFDVAPPGYYDYIVYDHRKEAYQLADETQLVSSEISESGTYSIVIPDNGFEESIQERMVNKEEDSDSIYLYGDLARKFRLGDCYFIIPPEFISVSTRSSHESIQGIRKSGSVKIKNGYSRKEVQMSLILNGMNQINGYPVESPMGYKYYVDGLRTLISQFKYTPFIPVENTMLNIVHDIHNVALRNIQVETIPGFPNTLQVNLVMQEFNATPYTRTANEFLDCAIDWDLYRYYVQQPLRDYDKNDKNVFPDRLYKIETEELTSKFAFSILTQESLNKVLEKEHENYKKHKEYMEQNDSLYDNNLYVDLYNKDNYEIFISSDMNIVMTNMNFSMGNIMPVIQLSNHESPTMQYLGATDVNFNFTFETTDTSIAAMFNKMNSENQELVRVNRYKNGIGFLRIENELVQLTGVEFLMMDEVTVSTVPSYPGLFIINVSCVSYDANQKDSEKLITMTPFEADPNSKDGSARKGTREDLLSQKGQGIANKIEQDFVILKKMQGLELYPDMHLPFLDDVDEAITKIHAFRDKHNLLERQPYTKYPRHKNVIPGSTEESEYNGYADPDFYVMCLTSLKDAKITGQMNETIKGIYNNGANTKEAIYNPENNSNSNAVNQIDFKTLNEALSSVENPMDIFPHHDMQPDVATEPEFAYGYEPDNIGRSHSGFLDEFNQKQEAAYSQTAMVAGTISQGTSANGNGAEGVPASVARKTGNPFVDLLCDRADAQCGYAFGFTGKVLNESTKCEVQGDNVALAWSKWKGRQCFDCSGLIGWGLKEFGIVPAGARPIHSSFVQYGTRISASSAQLGDVMVRDNSNSQHCAVFLNSSQTVEANSTAEGVIYKQTTPAKWDYAVRITGLQEACDRYLQSHPNFYNGGGSTTTTSNTTTAGGSNETASGTVNSQSVATASTSNVGTASTAKLGKIPAGVDGEDANQWDEMILRVCAKYNFDPNWIKASICVESRGNPNCTTSKSDARGLMQIIHQWWPQFDRNRLFEPEYNIDCGCQIFANPEYGPKWGFNKTKTIYAYFQGSGAANAVFNKKSKPYNKAVDAYLKSWNYFYNLLIQNGGDPGNTIKLLDGDATDSRQPGQGGMGTMANGQPSKPYVPNPFNTSSENFKNPNAGKTHGGKISSIHIASFGQNFIAKVATKDGKKYKFDYDNIEKVAMQANNGDKIIEYMFVDYCKYNMKGLLCRAFPSYILAFIDEQAGYIDGQKLWSNYYFTRSAIDINIYQSYDSPIATANVTLTNFYNNLTQVKKTKSVGDIQFDGYKWDVKKSVFGNIGYNANEAFRKGVYSLCGAVWDEEITDKMIEAKNKTYQDIMLEEGARVHIRLGYGSDPSRYPTCFNGNIAELQQGETVSFVAQSDGYQLVSHPLTDKTATTNKDLDLGVEVSSIVAKLLTARESGFWNAITFGNFKIESRYGLTHFGEYANKFISMDYKQYDIVKNLYVGTYEGVPFTKDPFDPWDGENNFRFSCAGKTVWDVMKMCEKAVPEFIAYPRYHNFDSRVFYGLPMWICKYQYNKKDNDLYDEGKSFAQVHFLSSLDSIIDNNIKVSSKNLATNMIGIYSLGGDLSSTPTIFSDKYIDWSKQKTRTIDTSSIQDFAWVPGVVDKLLSWTGMYDNGKQLAIKVCISELMNSWKETYTGEILLLGQPEINVYDYVYLSDTFLNMNGMITARGVMQSMSVGSGFTTTLIPGLIANNSLKNSGVSNVTKGIFGITVALERALNLSYYALKSFNKINTTFTAAKSSMAAAAKGSCKNFINGAGKGVFTKVKNLKAVTKGAELAKDAKDLGKTIKFGKTATKALSIGKTIGTAALRMFPPTLLATIALDIIISCVFTWIYDMFAYTNTINLYPLVLVNPDGSTSPLCVNKKGSKTLLPNEQNKKTEDKVDPNSEEAQDLDGLG